MSTGLRQFLSKHCACLWSEKTTVCRIFSCQRSGLPDSAGNLLTSGTFRSATRAALRRREAHGVHGMSVITAITAQNSLGVQGIWSLPLDAVRAQFRSVVDDIGVDAIKTGMLGSAETVDAVATLVRGLTGRAPIVVDPVCVSKHGDPLIDEDAVAVLRERLLPLATVVTPNLFEAARLAQLGVRTPPAELGRALLNFGPQWVLIKGGHSEGAARLPLRWRANLPSGQTCRTRRQQPSAMSQERSKPAFRSAPASARPITYGNYGRPWRAKRGPA